MSEQSQELTQYDPQLLAKARKLAGMRPSFPRISYLKVDYGHDELRGHFVLKDWNQEAEFYHDFDFGVSFTGTFLTVTLKCSQWDGEANQNIYESREFFSLDEVIQLIAGDKVVDEGTYSELKKKYPEIKFSLVLYVLLDNRPVPVKFFLRGKSLGEFWDYESTIAKSKGALQGSLTTFSRTQEKKGGIEYFVIHFAENARYDIPKLCENMLLSELVYKGVMALNEKFNERFNNPV